MTYTHDEQEIDIQYDVSVDDMSSIRFFEVFKAPIADYFDDPEAELDLNEDDDA